MHPFSPFVEKLVTLALSEDLCGGDVTTDALFDAGDTPRDARLVAKAPLVLCGRTVFDYVMSRVAGLPGAGGHVAVHFNVDDGRKVEAGTELATMQGPAALLLRGERIALNLLQRLSGIATRVRECVEALGSSTEITDTRKTTPGMRELERYAVRVGGGRNHRFNLAGGVLIKENHIAAAGGIKEAIGVARKTAPHTLKIEVEVSDLEGVQRALEAGADIIMLDNMSLEDMRRAVEITARRAVLEVSGNVTLERLPEIGKLGVDFVSSGALTHSVTAADISMLLD